MEKGSLKRTLGILMMAVLSVVAALSVITIFGVEIRQRLLDTRGITVDDGDYRLMEGQGPDGKVSYGYVLEAGNYSYGELSEKNQVYYDIVTVLLPVLPVCYVIVGAWTVVAVFYKRKLSGPIEALEDGMRHISEDDLDFRMEYGSEDELGMLCRTFEEMRGALYENNQRMWDMLQERKAMTASVSHDLRTPITVIRGYLDYLEKAEEKGVLTEDIYRATMGAMRESAGRLERYVECVQDVWRLEDVELERMEWDTEELLGEIEGEFLFLAKRRGRIFVMENRIGSNMLYLDKQMVFKILENVMNNALRFSVERIVLRAEEEGDYVIFTVEDDGRGFSAEELVRAAELFYSSGKREGNFGIGLAICKMLCEKQGGELLLRNRQGGGASVCVRLRKVE